jgi:hypothetical protein
MNLSFFFLFFFFFLLPLLLLCPFHTASDFQVLTIVIKAFNGILISLSPSNSTVGIVP